MSSLFDSDEPVELAPPDVVRALVDQYSYSPDKVRKWSREKAETVLASCRRKAHRDLNHAAAQAAAQEPEASREPNSREIGGRIEAATCLAQAVATNDPEEILFALNYSMFALFGEEARGFASLVLAQLRLHPVTGDPLVRRAAEVA